MRSSLPSPRAVGLNFCTAYIQSETNILITSHKLIAKHYARTWLLPDLISSIPYDWFITGIQFVADDTATQANDSVGAQLPQLLRIVKCVKLIRLLRIARAGRGLQKIVERLSLEVRALTQRRWQLCAGSPCRQSMPAVHAGSPCRQSTLAVHAGSPCRQSMLAVHAGSPCW